MCGERRRLSPPASLSRRPALRQSALMSEPVTAIPNLGPASATAFARIGLTTAEAVRALGADECYRRLLKDGNRPHFIGYYVLVMGLQGRPWNDCKGAEKAALRVRFDKLVAETRAENFGELESVLNVIGTGRRR
jgi:DNA transformation protein